MALTNQTMFLKFIFNQDMFRMNHHPSSVVQNKMKKWPLQCIWHKYIIGYLSVDMIFSKIVAREKL